MKKLSLFVSVLLLFFSCASYSPVASIKSDYDFNLGSDDLQIKRVVEIANRYIGDKTEEFDFFIDGELSSGFSIESRDSKIEVHGDCAGSLLSGLYYYLTSFCNYSLSWCGDNRALPKTLPMLDKKVEIESPFTYRPYFNFCTFNYSASWWDIKRWREEIEYMAFRGINMPLAIVGSEAVWVMQSWSLRKDILLAAPKERVLVFDLAGYKHKSSFNFYGYPFISGRLHNFGGRINMHGDIEDLAKNSYYNRSLNIKNFQGFGLFMEGINQNPFYYNSAFNLLFQNGSKSVDTVIKEFVSSRYGVESRNSLKAWRLLVKGPYQRFTDEVENSSILCSRPGLDYVKSGPNAGLGIPYDAKTVVDAWKLLLDNSTEFSSDGYRFDIMDIGRQALSNYAQKIFFDFKKAYKASDFKEAKRLSDSFLEILLDVDRLLMTREEYSFGKWLSDAIAIAPEGDKELFSLNASGLVTIWGPYSSGGEPQIFDYAWREWSGLLKEFYYPRWKLFFDYLEELEAEGKTFSDQNLSMIYGRPSFRANEFYSSIADFEIGWIGKEHSIDITSGESTVDVAMELYNKYFR